ncbi:MAG: glycosyltransferase family 39 protein, partial [Stellaceae bacterium]
MTTISDIAASTRAAAQYRDAALVFAVFAVGFAVRLYGIDFKPYWFDEIITLNRASLPVDELIRNSFIHNHSPLYFLILSPLTRLGDSETLLRLPSVLFGALACPIAAMIAARIGGRAAGAATGLLVALSPAMVMFSQEARSYALVTLLIAVALHCLTRLALDPQRAALPLRSPGAARGAWATYAFATVAAANTEGVALFWLVAGFIATLAMARQRGAGGGLLRNSLTVHGVVAILCVPCYLALALIVTARRPLLEALSWIPTLTPARFAADIGAVFLFQPPAPMAAPAIASGFPLLGVVIAVGAALGVHLLRRRHAILAALSLTAAIVPVALLAIAAFHSYWVLR